MGPLRGGPLLLNGLIYVSAQVRQMVVCPDYRPKDLKFGANQRARGTSVVIGQIQLYPVLIYTFSVTQNEATGYEVTR